MNNFKIGDLVEIKSWDEMVNEFGLDEVGDIECSHSLTSSMIHLCGKKLNIEEINEFDEVIFDVLETEEWNISMDMIKHVKSD